MGSKHFKKLQAPCGCLAEEEARQEPDEAIRKTMIEDAERIKDLWACPDGGRHPIPTSDDPPKLAENASQDDREDHERVLEAVSQVHSMTGVRCATCPWWYTAQPWVRRAATAYYRIANHAAVLVAEEHTSRLEDALTVISIADNKKSEYEERQREQTNG